MSTKNLINLLTLSSEYIIIKKDNAVVLENIPKDFFTKATHAKGIYYYKDTFYNKSKTKVNYEGEDYTLICFKNMVLNLHPGYLDPLTTILNKLFFEVKVQYLIQKKESFYFSVLDLDDLKDINDKYGHLVGDEILKYITSCFKIHLNDNDFAGRWGGDEFVIICLDDFDKALEKIKTIKEEVNKGFYLEGEKIEVSLSVGLIKYDFNLTYEENFSKIDKLLYQAKKEGKNKIIY